MIRKLNRKKNSSFVNFEDTVKKKKSYHWNSDFKTFHLMLVKVNFKYFVTCLTHIYKAQRRLRASTGVACPPDKITMPG